MRKFVYLAVLVLLMTVPLYARTKIQGYCEDGGVTVSVPGGTGASTKKYQ